MIARRTALWAGGGLVAGLALGAGALKWAVGRNGPAVLNTLDRIAGGAGKAQVAERAATGDHPAQKLIVWTLRSGQGAEPRPVMLFVHGGSWKRGDPDDYEFVARAFVEKGFVVVLAGYRLGPDGVFPAMVEDTASAVAWTCENIARHGGDPARLTLAGHSAGAYNVVMTALEPRWLGAHQLDSRIIANVVGLSGPYDFLPLDSESTRAAFGHFEPPELTQPITHVRADAPPILLVHGQQDTLVKPRNTCSLHAALEGAGGQSQIRLYPDMEHRDPLIALAAPWRLRRDIVGFIADFARNAGHAVASVT